MTDIHTRIPTKETLHTLIDDTWPSLEEELTHHAQVELFSIKNLQTNLRLALGVIIASVAIFIFFIFVSNSAILIHHSFGVLMALIAMTLVFVSFYNKTLSHVHKAYAAFFSKVDASIYRSFKHVFATPLEHTTTDEHHFAHTKKLLIQSKLVNEAITDYIFEDVLRGNFLEREMHYNEFQAVHIERYRSLAPVLQGLFSRNDRPIVFFKGVFVHYELPITLTGETFISTEGTKHKLAHSTFWNKVLGRSEVFETKLEWNEFDLDLHVATSNGSEARYILTPDFMEDLHSWWNHDKKNIRISFIKNHMYLLYPAPLVTFSTFDFKTHTFKTDVSKSAFKIQAHTLADPVWRTLLLLQDVQKQFRKK